MKININTLCAARTGVTNHNTVHIDEQKAQDKTASVRC